MKNKSLIPEAAKVTFESLKRVNEHGEEYWYARELYKVLEYNSWNKFLSIINKAKNACLNSNQPVDNHFSHVGKMVSLGSGSKRNIDDIELSRYACYLIVQNADSSKPVIANGQTYFAIQTRRQELQDNTDFKQLTEDQKRLILREELSINNKRLAVTAKTVGVISNLDYAIFQNHGYKGLYGGLDSKAIHAHKKLKKSQKILDHMGSTELAANLFRATQTDEKLKRDQVNNKAHANFTHYRVGVKVRNTIKDLGGTMPENLPNPDKSIKKLTRETPSTEKIEKLKINK